MTRPYAILIALWLAGSAAASFAQPRATSGGGGRVMTPLAIASSIPAGVDRKPAALHLAAGVATFEQARPGMTAASVRALAPVVFGARVRGAREPAIDGDTTWVERTDAVELPDPGAKKPFRPKVMPKVMGFPTGGGGVGLKFRY